MNALAQAVMVFIDIAGWLALAAGMALIIAPRATLRLSALFGERDPLVRLVNWLDSRHFIERYVYRHHRLFGSFVVVGALYTSFRLLTSPHVAALELDSFGAVALLGAIRFLLASNTVFVLVGVVIFVRPSALKGIEKRANRWITLGPERGGAGENRHVLARWLERMPRVAGAFLALAGFYLVSLVTIR